MAATLMLATGANAATLDPVPSTPTVVNTGAVWPGAGEEFHLYLGDTQYGADPVYNVYVVDLKITAGGVTRTEGFGGEGDPKNTALPFFWDFAPGEARKFSFSGTIRRYSNASFDPTGNQAGAGPVFGVTLSSKSTFYDETLFGNQEPPGMQLRAMSLAEATELAAVPIGGTLPLMLSALGLGAMVVRMRAKRAEAAA